MAARLQHSSAAQQPGQYVASKLRQAQRPGIATGRVAARNRGLRAPPRCHTEPYRLKWPTDSTHPWMTNGAQVTAVAHFDETKHSLDDPDRMLDFSPHLRFASVFHPLGLIHNTAVAIAPVDKVSRARCVLADHRPR